MDEIIRYPARTSRQGSIERKSSILRLLQLQPTKRFSIAYAGSLSQVDYDINIV